MRIECFTASSHVYAPCRQRNGRPSSSRFDETNCTSKDSTLTRPTVMLSKGGEILRFQTVRKDVDAWNAPSGERREDERDDHGFFNLHHLKNAIKLGMLFAARADHRMSFPQCGHCLRISA